MNVNRPTICICDQVFGIEYDQCDSSIRYLCEARTATAENPVDYQFDGKPVSEKDALQIAAEILSESRLPLVTGLGSIGLGSQQLAVDLAKKVSGIVDVGWENSAELGTLFRSGGAKATIGELISRCDCIVLVNCELWHTHPRFYKLLDQAKSASQFFWVGSDQYQDRFPQNICVTRNQINSVLEIVESKLAESSYRRPPERVAPEQSLDQLQYLDDQIDQFIGKLKESSFVGILFSSNGNDPFEITGDQLVSITQKLHLHSRAIALDIGVFDNSNGANEVCTWSTGFPSGVNLSGPSPESFHSEFKSANVLANAACDSALIFGDFSVGGINRDSIEHLEQLPKILFSWSKKSTVEKGLSIRYLDIGGDDFIRFDDLTFTLEPLPNSKCLSGFISELLKLL